MIGPKGNVVAYYDKIKMFDVKLQNKEKHQESKTYKPGKSSSQLIFLGES